MQTAHKLQIRRWEKNSQRRGKKAFCHMIKNSSLKGKLFIKNQKNHFDSKSLPKSGLQILCLYI